MGITAVSAAIAEARREYCLEIAETEEARLSAFRLRHKVYCVERRFEAAHDDCERDEFDAVAHHAIIRRRRDDEVLGTVRIVPALAPYAGRRFPMETAGDFPLLRRLPLRNTAEISRFSLVKSRTDRAAPLRLFLVRAVFMLSGPLAITHFCALMEPSLLRLLAASGIHFHPMGPLVEHHGLRQPSWRPVSDLLDQMRRDCPKIWEFATEFGTLWTHPREREAAIA